jgi:hypothetical protein
MIEWKEVNRVEVIDNNGRALTRYGCSDVYMDVQDEGRTLKIFLTSSWVLERTSPDGE